MLDRDGRCAMPSYGLLSLVASVALGALGWIATNFIARPILRAYELRERVWEELLVSANVSVFDGADYSRGVENLRRCAAQASALDVAWPPILRCVLHTLRLDLREATTALLGLSNTFGVSGRPDASLYRRQAGKALRLPADLIRPSIAPLGADGVAQAQNG
jgi:hypothetical protein